jgi:hypothetical protein
MSESTGSLKAVQATRWRADHGPKEVEPPRRGCGIDRIEVAQLRDLDLKALRLRWQTVTGRAAPLHLPRHLLFAMLAYRIQADAFGDLDTASLQLLKSAASASSDLSALTDRIDQRNQDLLPGAILTREWNGHTRR